MKFSRISEAEFGFLFFLLQKEINTFSEEKYRELLSEANKLSPHTKDDSYFALALKLNAPIWSDEKEFKQQDEIKIFSTNEISKELFGL